MSEKPPSTPEMWLMCMVGMGSGLLMVGLVTLFEGDPLPPVAAIAVGCGLIGVGILWYLWQTRDNYKDAILGDTDA